MMIAQESINALQRGIKTSVTAREQRAERRKAEGRGRRAETKKHRNKGTEKLFFCTPKEKEEEC
jgi:hypothetical protein